MRTPKISFIKSTFSKELARASGSNRIITLLLVLFNRGAFQSYPNLKLRFVC